MAEDKTDLKQRIKQSALWRKLHSSQGPILIAATVAVAAICLYLLCNLSSCNTRNTTTVRQSSGLFGTASDSTDRQLGEILSAIEGAGQTDVLITYDKAGALVGVVVVSEGASNQQVVVKLLRAVQTATGATLDQIDVFERTK